MWRPRSPIAFVVVLVGAAGLGALLVGAPAAPAAPSAACPVQADATNATAAACSVPTGGSFDPCSLVTAGLTHCAFNLPDVNPVDWLGWFECTIIADALAIWNAIVGYVGQFIVTLLNDLFALVEVPFQSLLNAVSSAVTGAITWFGNLVVGLLSMLQTIAAPLGPLAPIVVVTVTLAVFLAAGIGLYYVVIFLFAFGKTLFNLL